MNIQVCGRTVLPAVALIQIHQRYTATLNGLVLSIESGDGQWTAKVVDSSMNRTLYRAQRFGPKAAKVAAVDFALAWPSSPGAESPEAVAGRLSWAEHWN